MPDGVPARAVIVAGCRHGGLAAIRALGPLGFHVVAMSADPDAFGAASRHASDRVVCPDPSDAAAFTEFLLARAPAWRGALILETEDAYTEAIARNHDRLADSYHLVTPPWEVAQWFLQKDRTAELAATVAVAHPRTAPPDDPLGPGSALALPAMVKPVRSHEFVDAFGVKLWVFHRWDELREGVEAARRRGIEVVVQEVIPGSDAGTLETVELYINRDGTLGAHQCNVKLRQSPPMFGVMRAGRSVPVIPDVLDASLRLLHHVGFTGYASAEFKRDPRDGQAKLIEVNVRLPRNGALLARSGTNFPAEIHADLVEGRPSAPRPLQPSWFVDAFADLAELVRGDLGVLRHPASFFGPYVGRRRSSAVHSFRDVGPALRWARGKTAKLIGERRAENSAGDMT